MRDADVAFVSVHYQQSARLYPGLPGSIRPFILTRGAQRRRTWPRAVVAAGPAEREGSYARASGEPTS